MNRAGVKEYTRDVHEELENAILPSIRNLANLDDYLKLLEVFYGFYKPVEDAIEEVVNADVVPDLSSRRKSDWIRDDMNSMGHSEIPLLCHSVPDIRTEAEALGAMYVLEGSTLGGKFISIMISERLQKLSPALSFFNGYNGQTSSKWKSFLSNMESRLQTHEDWQQAADTARNVFVQFKKWVVSPTYVAS